MQLVKESMKKKTKQNKTKKTKKKQLSEVKERLEGPKYNIDLKGRGKGIGMSTMQKGAILRKCLNTFVPHCSWNFENV